MTVRIPEPPRIGTIQSVADGEPGGEHDLIAEQLARARSVHPSRDELLADIVLAEAREPPGSDVTESAGDGVERAATAGLVDLRPSSRLCDVPVGADLVERRGARRAAEAEDEDRHTRPEKEDTCDCNDFQAHVYTSISTIFLIANQPEIRETTHVPSAKRPGLVSQSGSSQTLLTEKKKSRRTIGIAVRM